MSRIHGRNGVLYLGATAGAAASPVAFLSDWVVTFAQSFTDVTTLTDKTRIWTPAEPDYSGTFTGWYDDGSSTATSTYDTTYSTIYSTVDDSGLQMYTAAVDGLPRNFYLYPNTNTPSQYFQGIVTVTEFDVTAGVTAGAAVSGAWVTSTTVTLIKNAGGTYSASYAAAY